MVEVNVGVCPRHDMGVSQFIFDENIPQDILLKPAQIEKIADTRLNSILSQYQFENCGLSPFINALEYADVGDVKKNIKLNIYVTGLTVATMAAVKSALWKCRNVSLWHFDKENNTYYEQVIC